MLILIGTTTITADEQDSPAKGRQITPGKLQDNQGVAHFESLEEGICTSHTVYL